MQRDKDMGMIGKKRPAIGRISFVLAAWLLGISFFSSAI